MTRPRVKPTAEDVKRPYRSTLRADQALETRRRIREAAERLFLTDGYVATSMAAIADAAAVSRPTVFNTFGSKVDLLREISDVRLAGDDAPMDLLSRPVGRRMLEATDPEEVLRRHARFSAEINSRVAPLITVLTDAASTDPDAAALRAEQEEGRLYGMRATVERLAELGALRPGVSVARGAEALWLICAPELWTLAQRRGWSTKAYVDWYLRCARAILLES